MSDAPLLVHYMIWAGNFENIYKVPFHTFGAAKRRNLRLKPWDPNVHGWVDVRVVLDGVSSNNQVARAAQPLALIWGDSIPNSATVLPIKTASPFSKRVKEENGVLLQDIVSIAHGNSTVAFRAFIAKNGKSCIPHQSCCFSIITSKRSVDFFVSSSNESQTRDAQVAQALVDSLNSLLQSYNQRQRTSIGLLQSSLDAITHEDGVQKSKELFEAAQRSDLARMRYLLDQGLSVETTIDSSRDTVLLLACRLGMYDVCKLVLLEYSAKNDPHPSYGQTALQVAVSSGHAKIVKLLLDTAEPSGADRIICNHEDEFGEAPIHTASRCGQIKTMELLLSHGAQLGLVDRRGRTCLHCAASSGHASCLAFALEFGGDEYIEVKQDNGFTSLHLAIRANSIECVRILLTAGADSAATTPNGYTAYELASKQRNQAIVKLLLEYEESSESCYSGSCSGESSWSGNDMFAGLNTYAVNTPAPKNALPPMHEQSDQTPSTYYTAKQTPNYFPTPGHFMSPQLHIPSPGRPSNYGQVGLFQQQTLMSSPESFYGAQVYNHEAQFVHNGDLWTINYSDEGYPYYFNPNTNISTWDDPRFSSAGLTNDELEDLSQIRLTTVATHETAGQNFVCVQGEPMTPEQGSQSSASCNASSSAAANKKPPNHNIHAPAILNQSSAKNSAKLAHTPLEIPQQINVESAGESIDGNGNDTRAASIEILKKRAPKTDVQMKKPAPIAQKPSHERNGSIGDDKVPDPTAALMKLEKRSPVLIKNQSEQERSTLTSSSKAGLDEPNPDPRAALMAMLKTRNTTSVDNQASTAEDTLKKSSAIEQASEGVAGNTKGTNSVTVMSKDELMADPILEKFVKMTSFGVPPQAAVLKMKQESVDESKICIFQEFHGLLPRDQSQKPSNDPQQSIPTIEHLLNDSVLAKYIKMTKVGVPVPAVCIKMDQDNVDKHKVQQFNLVFGLVKAKSPKRSPLSSVPRGRRRANTTLQKIHWNTVDQSLLRDSVWASQDDSELDEHDIEKLESLFAAAQTNRQTGVAKRKTVKKDAKMVSLIDPKRANNIAIALAQYRSFVTYESLIDAVITLNNQNLDLEKLQNMTLLLPKKEEVKRLEQCGHTSEGLGRAEQFFLAVMKVPRFSQKLSAFIFLLQFEESASTLFSNLHTLSRACQEVTASKKLKMILKRFLAIGNVMNESAGKPLASGISLDSLIKTAKMKGKDGKTTILDSVVSNRLELADFRSDMPTMRDAMRLDLNDLTSNLKELENGINAIEHTIAAEKADVDSSDDWLISHASGKFLEKLKPFRAHAMSELDNIKASVVLVEDHVQLLCSFFAEENNTKASTIFGVLLEFSGLVERSAEQLKRIEAMEQRRQSLRTPIKTSRPKPAL